MPPPTVADQVLTDAAKTLTPDKSLDRAETHAKYLFSTVTIFGTLVTGFGILSGNKAIAREPWLLIVPLSMICVSLALSMYVLTPSRGVVNLDNLVEVKTYFGQLIRRRGLAIFIAGILFAIALISIIPIIAFANRNLVSATLTAKAIRTAKSDNISATFKYGDLPPGVLATITADAMRTDGVVIPVFKQISRPHDGGDLSGDIAVPEEVTIKQVTIRAEAVRGNYVIHEDTVVLTLTPRPAPPPATRDDAKVVRKAKRNRGA